MAFHRAGNCIPLLGPVIHEAGYTITESGFLSAPKMAPQLLNVDAEIRAPARHRLIKYIDFNSPGSSKNITFFVVFHSRALHQSMSSDNI